MVNTFFCRACLTDKPLKKQSIWEGYCSACHDFLKEEDWLPPALRKKQPLRVNQNALQRHQDDRETCHLEKHGEILVPETKSILTPQNEANQLRKNRIFKGRTKIQLPIDKIKRMWNKGSTLEEIILKLEKKENIIVSKSTLKRRLNETA